MLNNTDSVLKKGEVEGAIQDYEALFAGARTEVCFPSLPPLCIVRTVVLNVYGAWHCCLYLPSNSFR